MAFCWPHLGLAKICFFFTPSAIYCQYTWYPSSTSTVQSLPVCARPMYVAAGLCSMPQCMWQLGFIPCHVQCTWQLGFIPCHVKDMILLHFECSVHCISLWKMSWCQVLLTTTVLLMQLLHLMHIRSRMIVTMQSQETATSKKADRKMQIHHHWQDFLQEPQIKYDLEFLCFSQHSTPSRVQGVPVLPLPVENKEKTARSK